MKAVEQPAAGPKTPVIARLKSHFPPQQMGRYLVVGIGNTVFGYATFALLTALLSPLVAHGYILANLLSSLINITFSYFGYKFLVFKTKGNYLREWLRCLAVYSGGIIVSTLLLPVLVVMIRRGTGLAGSAPYLAGALMIALNTMYSFIGHKRFSFRSSMEPGIWQSSTMEPPRAQPEPRGSHKGYFRLVSIFARDDAISYAATSLAILVLFSLTGYFRAEVIELSRLYFRHSSASVSVPYFSSASQAPISPTLTAPGNRRFIRVHFRFRSGPASSSFPNVFQTASGNGGVRMELSNGAPGLVFTTVEGKTFGISLSPARGEWHKVEIVAISGEYLRASIDGESLLVQRR